MISYLKIMDYSEEISISKAKELLTKDLLVSREARQVLSNLQSMIEAIEIFRQRNILKQI